MTALPSPRRATPLASGLLAAALLAASGCASPGPIGSARLPAPGAEATRRAAPAVRAARHDVALLRSPDFVERAHAAERLVARGPAALAALGAAGGQPVPAPGGQSVSSTRPVVEAVLAAADGDAVRDALGAPWPSVREVAASELGQRGRWSPVPALIERLHDADPDVRAAAAASLRRLTNEFFGYRASASVAARDAAARRWRSWWTREGRARARRADGAPGIAGR